MLSTVFSGGIPLPESTSRELTELQYIYVGQQCFEAFGKADIRTNVSLTKRHPICQVPGTTENLKTLKKGVNREGGKVLFINIPMIRSSCPATR